MSPERRATAWLLAMCVIWGSTFFSMQMGIRGIEKVLPKEAAPAVLLFLRFLAATVLFPIVFPKLLKDLSPAAAAWGLLLSLPFYAGFLLQVMGLADTTSTVSAFITNLTVVLTPVFGRLFFGERLAGRNLVGAAVALAGVFVLTNPGGGGLGRGEILTAVSAVAFAVQIQLTNVVTRRAPPEAVTFVMFAAATLFSAAVALGQGIGPADVVRACGAPDAAWTILYTATVCSIVAIAIMNRFQRDLPPTRAAVLYTLEPVFAACFAAGIQGEEMTWRKVAGGAIIVGGNLLCELLGRRRSGE